MTSDYEEYCITEQHDPWGYGQYPNEPALLTRAGYRELLRCLNETTGECWCRNPPDGSCTARY